MEKAIVTEGLTKIFKSGRKRITAVDNLNLQVERGEIFGFIGPNGAGKSTTIKMLLSILFPTSGRAWIFGEDIGTIEARRKVGYLPENPRFYDYLTGEEFLTFAGTLAGLSGRKLKSEVESLLKCVNIYEAKDRKLKKYSKGMIQRIGLAQALIGDPELIILDEPTSGLDPLGRKLILELIKELKKSGKTVFFSTHILKDVEEVADSVAIIHRGKLLKTLRLDRALETDEYEVAVSELSFDGIKIASEIAMINERKQEFVVFKVHESKLWQFIDKIRENHAKILWLKKTRRSLEDIFVETVREE